MLKHDHIWSTAEMYTQLPYSTTRLYSTTPNNTTVFGWAVMPTKDPQFNPSEYFTAVCTLHSILLVIIIELDHVYHWSSWVRTMTPLDLTPASHISITYRHTIGVLWPHVYNTCDVCESESTSDAINMKYTVTWERLWHEHTYVTMFLLTWPPVWYHRTPQGFPHVYPSYIDRPRTVTTNKVRHHH